MDIDVIDLDASRPHSSIDAIPHQSRTTPPFVDDRNAPPEAGPSNPHVQMDVDNDMGDLCWNLPMGYIDEGDFPYQIPLNPSNPSLVIHSRANTPTRETIGPDEFLTTWIRIRHSKEDNPWIASQPHKKTRKPFSKTMAKRSVNNDVREFVMYSPVYWTTASEDGFSRT